MGNDAGQDSLYDAHNIAFPSTRTFPLDRPVLLTALLNVWDAVAVFLSGYICALIYSVVTYDTSALPDADGEFLTMALRTSVLGGLLAPVVLRQDLTRGFLYDLIDVIGHVALNVLVLLGLLLAIGFLTRTLIYLPRIWFVGWSATMFVSVVGGRLLVVQLSSGALVRHLLRNRIALVGDRPVTAALESSLRDAHGPGIEIVGQFEDGDASDVSLAGRPGRDISCLIEFAKRYPIDKMILAVPAADTDRLERALGRLKGLDVEIVHYSGAIGTEGSEPLADGLDDERMITIASRPLSRRGLVLKVLEDQVLGAILVIWLLPLMVLIMIAIKLDSPGPVFFRQRRHGLNNAEFNIFKFRTMTWEGQAHASGAHQTQPNDPRITRVGRFLRRSSFDEFPQLFNVLRGEMSLVGPRPHPVAMRTENRLSAEIVRNYAHRHRVKPGLTGWAQINGLRGATSTDEQIRWRVEHDLFYIDNWSIFLDLKILALTPIRMITDGDGAF